KLPDSAAQVGQTKLHACKENILTASPAQPCPAGAGSFINFVFPPLKTADYCHPSRATAATLARGHCYVPFGYGRAFLLTLRDRKCLHVRQHQKAEYEKDAFSGFGSPVRRCEIGRPAAR